MPEPMTGRFNLEIEAPANGRFTKSTVIVRKAESNEAVFTDKADLVASDERKKLAKKIAEALLVDLEPLLELLEARWNEIVDQRDRIRAEAQAKEAAPPPLQAHEEDPEAEELRQLGQMPDAVRREAEESLRDPSLMERVVADLELMGVAGEVSLKATLYLVFTSRKLSRPLSARVRGPSSSGKSYVIEKVAELIPPESKILASQMTPQALFYLEKGSLRHKLIVAGERSRNQEDEAADGTRALREMVSAGRLSKLVPLKGENGMETVLIEQEGPISFIESTTLGEIFAEDDNRMLSLFTDERAEQTRRIIKSLATAATRQSADLHKLESIRQLYWAMQRLLRRLEIVIPFASRLGATLPDQRVETRRAFPYLLSMIAASALLHQYQRQRDAEGRVIAVREDYVNAALLLAGPMQRLLGRGISDQASRFCERLKKWFPAGQPFYTREALAKEQGSRSAVYGWLVELRNAGAVKQVNESSGGRGAIWQVSGPEVGSATATAEFVLPTADLVFGPNVAA